jgi:uncharacterized circularly permuted ATP-grasp superfamily protein
LPATAAVDRLDDGVLADRNAWVLKPVHGSGGQGVVIGAHSDAGIWEQALDCARQGGWIAQRQVQIPTYRIPSESDPSGTQRSMFANWNPFFFGGTSAGGITRVSPNPIVGITNGGALLPTLLVNDAGSAGAA